jgi:hypothetical protein
MKPMAMPLHLTGPMLDTYRKIAGVSQAEMAQAMRLPLRTFEDILAGKSQLREVHLRAAEMGMLALAWKNDDASKLPKHLKDLVREVAALLDAEDANKKPA